MLTGLLKMVIGAMLISVVTISCSSTSAKDSQKSAAPMTAKLPVDVKVVKAESLDEQEVIAGSLVPNREVRI